MSEIIDQMRIWIEQGIQALGYVGIALIMCIENLFPPIPSELVMPLAGFLVVKGEFTLLGIILAGTIGSVVGAIILYYIGLWADEPIVRNFIRRFGRYFFLSESDLDRAMDFFNRYRQPVVFFGRLIPIIRSLISLPAGMNRMPMGTFLIFTTLGSAIWTTVLSVAGLILAENWELILDYVDRYQKFTLIVLILAVIIFIVMRVRSYLQNKSVSDPTSKA
jgi:Uncharacterized membrane-associated protein